MKRAIYIFLICILNLALYILPFSRMRVIILKIYGAKIGSSTYIGRGVRVDFPWRIFIGNNCFISNSVYFDCRGGSIVVMSNTDISESAVIYTLSHDINSENFCPKKGNVTIGSRVWICTRAILLPGSKIEDGTVLGANSVSKGLLSGNSLYSGIPAIYVRSLKPNRAIAVRK